MVKLKEDLILKSKRGAISQLKKIKSIVPDYIFEEGDYNIYNSIHIYKQYCTVILKCKSFRKSYVGEIYYDPTSLYSLNMKGNTEILKPIAEKLEQNGFEVTIYY